MLLLDPALGIPEVLSALTALPVFLWLLMRQFDFSSDCEDNEDKPCASVGLATTHDSLVVGLRPG